MKKRFLPLSLLLLLLGTLSGCFKPNVPYVPFVQETPPPMTPGEPEEEGKASEATPS